MPGGRPFSPAGTGLLAGSPASVGWETSERIRSTNSGHMRSPLPQPIATAVFWPITPGGSCSGQGALFPFTDKGAPTSSETERMKARFTPQGASASVLEDSRQSQLLVCPFSWGGADPAPVIRLPIQDRLRLDPVHPCPGIARRSPVQNRWVRHIAGPRWTGRQSSAARGVKPVVNSASTSDESPYPTQA